MIVTEDGFVTIVTPASMWQTDSFCWL